MKQLAVCSDIHGSRHALQYFLTEIEPLHVDALLIAGDVGLKEVGVLLQNLPYTLVMVRGNCDLTWDYQSFGFKVAPRVTVQKIKERTVAMSHGDYYSDWRALPIDLHDGDIFVTGHTHVATLRKVKHGPYILNPGSLSYPRDGREPSYALIDEQKIVIKTLRTKQIIEHENLSL
ncbi:MAG: metallophosphoesterase family protein [Sphaerochaetaceae bacterium]|jgi:putative phosphoesterase